MQVLVWCEASLGLASSSSQGSTKGFMTLVDVSTASPAPTSGWHLNFDLHEMIWLTSLPVSARKTLLLSCLSWFSRFTQGNRTTAR